MRRASASSAVIAVGLWASVVVAGERTVAVHSTDSVVSVVAFDHEGTATGYGGGFVASKGLIVSAWGIVKNADQIRVFHASGQELFNARLVESNQDDGYVLIQVEDAGLLPVTVGNSDLVRVGDPVEALSVPMGFERTLLTGRVNGWTGPSEPQRMLTSLPRTQGMIGGPLFNQAGEVIGVNLAEGDQARSLPINRVDMAKRAADLP